MTEWMSYNSRTKRVDARREVIVRGEVCAFRFGEGGLNRFSGGSGGLVLFRLKMFHSFWKVTSSKPGMDSYSIIALSRFLSIRLSASRMTRMKISLMTSDRAS